MEPHPHPDDALREALSRFFARNRMALVIFALTSTWVGLSWAVWRAEAGAENAQITSFGKALWWGVVTFMTVGYGDLTPVTPLGRSLAVPLMLSGVIAIGIITAKISTYFLQQILMEGRGAVDKSKIKNHVIICGWKEDMQDLIEHVLFLNPGLRAKDVVIVANKPHEAIAALKANPKLESLHVIIGDYFQQATLVRAAPEVARKVLILADTSTGPDGRKPNATEADARTIMTAIALANVAKGTMVAAEILDPALDSHLKLAGVGEIIYSREYSRLLLGSASVGTGLANVFHDLIDPRAGAHIVTQDIPETFVDRSYRDFRDDFERRHGDKLLLGILENTGNPHTMKQLAFQEAQKTPSVPRLIDNLRNVKTLRCNNPIFHPRPDYKIAKGSAAIVLNARSAAADARSSRDERQEEDHVAA